MTKTRLSDRGPRLNDRGRGTTGTDGGEPDRIEETDKSLSDLAGELTSEVTAFVNDHLQLARVEMTNEIKHAGRSAGLMGGAAVAGWIAALVLSFAAAWALAEVLVTWLAFLVVGVVWLLAAGVMALLGKKQMDETDFIPDKTMVELERDKQWLSEQRRKR